MGKKTLSHAVLLSSYIIDTDTSHRVGAYYLDLIKSHFADCKIYIGINTGSSDIWRKMIKSSGLDVNICEVKSGLTVNSDVSGFQAILQNIKEFGSHHDYYWFGHTKGSTHETYEAAEALRWVIDRDFWSRRSEIEAHCDPLQHGTFPALPMPCGSSWSEDGASAYLRRIFPATCRPIGYVTTYTFFGMTGPALRTFLESVASTFFESNLVNEGGVSRYFFEGGFAWVADMGGFEPYLLAKEVTTQKPLDLTGPCHPNDFIINQLKVEKMIQKWKEDPSGYEFTAWT